MTSTRYAAKHGPNLHNTILAIISKETFNAGNLWAAQGAPYGAGQMPERWRVLSGMQANHIGYVVYSYRTPIAWFDTLIGEWVFPDVKYSPTTSAHQSVVRRALSPAYISGTLVYAKAVGTSA